MATIIYTPLNIGDILQEGDEFLYHYTYEWVRTNRASRKITSEDCAYRRPIVPGEGYVFVEIGDYLKQGDEYYDKGEWYLSSCSKSDNNTCRLETIHNMIYRRKKPVEKLTEQDINPGEGYVRVDDDDIIIAGDEYYDCFEGWSVSRQIGEKPNIGAYHKLVYRRKAVDLNSLLKEVKGLRAVNKTLTDKVDQLLRYSAKYKAIEEICNKN